MYTHTHTSLHHQGCRLSSIPFWQNLFVIVKKNIVCARVTSGRPTHSRSHTHTHTHFTKRKHCHQYTNCLLQLFFNFNCTGDTGRQLNEISCITCVCVCELHYHCVWTSHSSSSPFNCVCVCVFLHFCLWVFNQISLPILSICFPLSTIKSLT